MSAKDTYHDQVKHALIKDGWTINGDIPMSTKELLFSEINSLNQEELEELYTFVKEFLASKQQKANQPTFLERLSQIQIDGPEDFAENIDLYLSGEKTIDSHLH